MQKLSDVRFPDEKDIPALKELWHEAFGDDYEYIDDFFATAFKIENTLVICDGDTVVSALYLVESHIIKGGRRYNAYYVYAVATLSAYRGRGLMSALLKKADEVSEQRNISYLFLVPANISLYDTYGRFGYKKGIFCKEDTVYRKVFSGRRKVAVMDYKAYLRIRNEFSADESIVFEKNAFSIFISPERGDVKSLCIENIGCCIYEKVNGEVVVWELYGDEDIVLGEVFELCGVNELRVRKSGFEGVSPCGMYKIIGDAPKLKNAFLGAYGG